MKKIKYLIMDVDGTLTDGKIYMGNDGEVVKVFNIKDGYGIRNIAIPAGIEPVIITGRTSKILEKRCKELGILTCYQGESNKVKRLNKLLNSRNAAYANVAYIGDDLNDLSCMILIKKNNGLIGCPADASEKIKELSDYICSKNGGNGAVREFIEWIVKNNIYGET